MADTVVPMVIDARRIGDLSMSPFQALPEVEAGRALGRLISDVARIAVPHATVEISRVRLVELESDAPDFVDGDV